MATPTPATPPGSPAPGAAASDLRCLRALERKVLWLAVWTIHHANHLRPSRDGLKVGGHQASSASVAALMTALYFDALRPEDRVAVKPHASPVFHAIQYLLGNQTQDQLARFRGFGGAQSYPSRTKDTDDVDFSTGSVGLGVAMTSFAALVQDYVRLKRFGSERPPGRMIAIAGDAEFDEGNIFEALVESWKHDVRNVWWIIDYNRQSLDAVMVERFSDRLETVFRNLDWRVKVLKYGRLLTAAFERPGGDALRQWIDSAERLALLGPGLQGRRGVARGTAARPRRHPRHPDPARRARRRRARAADDQPGRTRSGHPARRLPRRGGRPAHRFHRLHHQGLRACRSPATRTTTRDSSPPTRWRPSSSGWASRTATNGTASPGSTSRPTSCRRFWMRSPSGARPAGGMPRRASRCRSGSSRPPAIDCRPRTRSAASCPTSRGANPDLADRVVTSSPDVTVSTSLGSWLNRRHIFGRRARGDLFKDKRIVSALNWEVSADGQHIELGIAENNLFILLAALGLSAPLFGERLLPIGTVYDPFISRGLDALNYACYQDARFIVVGTPSGVSLAAEGGAHPVDLRAAARHGSTRADVVRADLRGRAVRDPALELRAPAGRRRRCRLPAPLHAPGGSAGPEPDRGSGAADHGRRLLADASRSPRGDGARGQRRGAARGNRGRTGRSWRASPMPDCWWSPRSTGSTAGGPQATAAASGRPDRSRTSSGCSSPCLREQA